MLRIDIANNRRGPDNAALYDYTVYVNGRVIEQGVNVGPHDRSERWPALLRKLADHSEAWHARLLSATRAVPTQTRG